MKVFLRKQKKKKNSDRDLTVYFDSTTKTVINLNKYRLDKSFQ